jgi:hypothetical protein
MASRINWKGDPLKRKAEKASMLGIDATISAAIMHARSNHGAGAHAARRFVTHTGELERHTKFSKHARRTRRGVVGSWGIIGLAYGRRIELGFQGKDARGAVVDAPAFPFLRPAAEAEYPKLAGRIRRAANFA